MIKERIERTKEVISGNSVIVKHFGEDKIETITPPLTMMIAMESLENQLAIMEALERIEYGMSPLTLCGLCGKKYRGKGEEHGYGKCDQAVQP
jgi:hypothetical protein